MKKLCTNMLIACCLTLAHMDTSTADHAITYSVGVVPQFETGKLHRIWQPVIDHLQQMTGLKFKLLGTPDFDTFERQLAEGKFDFAFMNPYQLLINMDAGRYIPLVRDHQRQLHGIITVRNDSLITDPRQLQNQTVAFSAPNALGASLLVRQELKDNFGVAVTPIYVKTHDSVYLNVLLGETIAGGGVHSTLKKQPVEYRNQLRIIHMTRHITPHPFAAHTRMDEAIISKVTEALLEMGRHQASRQLLQEIPIRKIGVATRSDYDKLRQLQLERFYIGSK